MSESNKKNDGGDKNNRSDGSSSNAQAIREVELSGKDAHKKLAELLGNTGLSSSELLGRLSGGGHEKSGANGETQKEHKFWSTQPVPQLDEADEAEADEVFASLHNGDPSHLDSTEPPPGAGGRPIETKTVADVRAEPYPLIDSFEWTDIRVTDDTELEEVYRLLNENYVEDGESMFRFDYSRAFLRWALLPPGWHTDWHVGVRVKSSRKLVAFISAIPATLRVHRATTLPAVEINFLCVHKKLRSKRLAPVLIREITRRVNLRNIWQAAYTAGALLPKPVSSSRYYHRSLNPKKLIDVGFSRLQPRMTMARTIKLYALRDATSVPGIRPLRSDDVPEAAALFNKYCEQFSLHVSMTTDEFEHWFLPREGVIYTYVVEKDDGTLTDLVSFYSLPSSIIQHPIHSVLNAAYAFCTGAMTTSITDLMGDALVLAKQNGFDVFNALDLAHNAQFFKDLKFHIGDGELNYYLYNWKCRPVAKETNALVLL